MILMRMANQDSRRSRQIERGRQQARRALRSVQGTSRIEDESLTVRMRYFDATAANLLGAAVNGEG